MLSADLIKQLAEDEPELDIKPGVNMEVIMFRSGRQSIIKELLYRLEHNETDNTEVKF